MEESKKSYRKVTFNYQIDESKFRDHVIMKSYKEKE
jgi:hypothetical protein